MIRRKIFHSLLAISLLISVGLLSRHIPWVPVETGDAFWAMMIFAIWRILLLKKSLKTVAWVSLLHAYLVEFSQLIRWTWLVEFRETFIGHMMLGQGFLWIDLLAYTIGIAIIYVIFRHLEK